MQNSNLVSSAFKFMLFITSVIVCFKGNSQENLVVLSQNSAYKIPLDTKDILPVFKELDVSKLANIYYTMPIDNNLPVFTLNSDKKYEEAKIEISKEVVTIVPKNSEEYMLIDENDKSLAHNYFSSGKDRGYCFYEDWIFDSKDFKFHKKVHAISFSANFEKYDPNTGEIVGMEPIKNMVVPLNAEVDATYLNNPSQQPEPQATENESVVNIDNILAKKVVYSVDLSNSETESYPYHGKLNKELILKYFLDEISEKKILVYDEYNGDIHKKKYLIDVSVDTLTESFRKKMRSFGKKNTIQIEYDKFRKNLGRLLFYEDWYIDTETSTFFKEVKAVGLITLNEQIDWNTGEITGFRSRLEYIIPFDPDIYPLYLQLVNSLHGN